jgi:hypothetical protein
MSSGIKQAQPFEHALVDEQVRATALGQATAPAHVSGLGQATAPAHASGLGQATAPAHANAQPDQLPPMTAESARRLAALLAPHLMAMRVVTAGTPYGAHTEPATSAKLPPASAATRIFIAGMLERISA